MNCLFSYKGPKLLYFFLYSKFNKIKIHEYAKKKKKRNPKLITNINLSTTPNQTSTLLTSNNNQTTTLKYSISPISLFLQI